MPSRSSHECLLRYFIDRTELQRGGEHLGTTDLDYKVNIYVAVNAGGDRVSFWISLIMNLTRQDSLSNKSCSKKGHIYNRDDVQ